MRIEGITALVTGGASGLGFATAQRLVDSAADVVLADLPSSPGPESAKGLGERAVFAPTDVTDEDSVNAALDAAERFGPVRVVVNCAGDGRSGRVLGKAGPAPR